VWSPNGQEILFLDNGFVNGVGRIGLATMKPDGSDRQFISSKNIEAHQADWESIAAGAKRLERASAPSTGRLPGQAGHRRTTVYTADPADIRARS
jgi:hypothetical protein